MANTQNNTLNSRTGLTVGALAFLGGLVTNGIAAGYLYGGLERDIANNRDRIDKIDTFVERTQTEDIKIVERLVKIEVLLQEMKQSLDRERARNRALQQPNTQKEREAG